MVCSVYGFGMINRIYYVRGAVNHFADAPSLPAGTAHDMYEPCSMHLMQLWRNGGRRLRRLHQMLVRIGTRPPA